MEVVIENRKRSWLVIAFGSQLLSVGGLRRSERLGPKLVFLLFSFYFFSLYADPDQVSMQYPHTCTDTPTCTQADTLHFFFPLPSFTL